MRKNIVFHPDGETYKHFRLPGMVVTAKGTLLIAWEARVVGSDLGEIDLYIGRSTDGGIHFDSFCLAKGGSFSKEYGGLDYKTLNNPVMMIDTKGYIHLLFSYNAGYNGLFHCRSDDDGISWTTPMNILSQLGGCGEGYPDRQWLACGPTHGVCSPTGRLIAPVWIATSNFSKYPVYTIYSDDDGETWNLGERVSENLDETAIAVLSDGNIMLNSRQFSVPYNDARIGYSKAENASDACRRISISNSGISNWSKTVKELELPDPGCAGSLCSALINNVHALLFVNNADTTSRRNLCLYCSTDDGKSWSYRRILDQNFGGYSDVAIGLNGEVYVIREIERQGKPVLTALELFTFSAAELFSGEKGVV